MIARNDLTAPVPRDYQPYSTEVMSLSTNEAWTPGVAKRIEPL